jgi:hypothetical protein
MIAAALALLVAGVSAQQAAAPRTESERLSYALGMSLGQQLRKHSVEVDVAVYLKGLEDALSGKQTELSEADARALLTGLQNEVRRRTATARTPGAGGAADLGGPAASLLSAIDVSFKLDPRITRSLYMGERWLPLPFTQVGGKTAVVVYARAAGRDGRQKPVHITPEWTPADPELVTVRAAERNVMEITVLGPGETTLRVTAQGISTELAIKSAYKGEALQVEISRKTS